MKKISFLSLSLLLCVLAFSQDAIRNWHFGNNVSLYFPPSGAPPTVSTGSFLTNEGNSSISDNSGNLILSTDGTNVYDASGNIVNTQPLLGNSSSTQSALVVPKPNSSSYLIFTMDDHINNMHGLNYSEFIFSGGVLSELSLNNPLLPQSVTTERITAGCQSNGIGYWLATVKKNGDFVVYPITALGVGSPIISSGPGISAQSYSGDATVGYMKISPDGSKIAIANRWSNSSAYSELFSFDSSTGKVTSNDGTIHTGAAYGVEFSGNSNYLYLSTFHRVYQIDLNSTNLTKTQIYNNGSTQHSNMLGALQMGPDGKIYVSIGHEGINGNFLDVIEDVNTATPTYNTSAIDLQSNGVYGRMGLPDFVSCFVNNNPPDPTSSEPCFIDDIKINYTQDGCNYTFDAFMSLGANNNIVSYLWTFGDGTSSTEKNPTHQFFPGEIPTICLKVIAFDGEICCNAEFCQEMEPIDCIPEACDAEISFIYGRDNCTINFLTQLISSNRPVVGWYWDFDDGLYSYAENPNHVFNNGTYNVCLTVILEDEEGCCTFTYCEDVIVDCTPASSNKVKRTGSNQLNSRIIDNNPDKKIIVSPNPSSGKYTVNIHHGDFDQLIIRNIQGKLVRKYNLTNDQSNFDIEIEDQPSGIYMINLFGNDQRETMKISKQ